MHVGVVMSGIDPRVLALELTESVVNGGQLQEFVNTTEELLLLQSWNVTTLSTPFSSADAGGYNSGNLLIGAPCQWFASSLIDAVQGRRRSLTVCCCSGRICSSRSR